MKLLLDTVTFLDAAFAPRDITGRARDLILDPDNELYVSVVSSWEIAIKHSLGKLRLPEEPAEFVPGHRTRLGAEILPLDEESVFHTIRLPHIHNDPFDRILIGQAMIHAMVLLTPDPRIAQYPVRTAW